MTSVEIWKPVPGYPGYEASNLGEVKSRGRTVDFSMSRDGYPKVGRTYVHTFVMLAFRGKPPEGYECAHYDGNKLNNTLANLRYATRLENSADTLRHGKRPRGERNGRAKLTEADVIAIRSMRGMGKTIAIKFNVSAAVISAIKHRKAWGWL
jgi:hypothetical protein